MKKKTLNFPIFQITMFSLSGEKERKVKVPKFIYDVSKPIIKYYTVLF